MGDVEQQSREREGIFFLSWRAHLMKLRAQNRISSIRFFQRNVYVTTPCVVKTATLNILYSVVSGIEDDRGRYISVKSTPISATCFFFSFVFFFFAFRYYIRARGLPAWIRRASSFHTINSAFFFCHWGRRKYRRIKEKKRTIDEKEKKEVERDRESFARKDKQSPFLYLLERKREREREKEK